jgi:AraC-like DNA-binding protein
MVDAKAEYTFLLMDEERAHWTTPRIEAAPPDLRHYIDASFVTVSAGPPNENERGRRLPEGASYIVFLRGRRTATGVREDETALVVGGPQEKIHDIPTWEYRYQCGIRLQPGAAGLILGLPAVAMTNTIVPLSEIWGSRARALEDRLLMARSDSEASATLCHAVRQALIKGSTTDLFTVRLARAVRRAQGDSRITDLARDFGTTVRTFERRFKSELGLGPKAYQRIARIAKVLNSVQSSNGSWADVAVAAGYYDQAHMVDDCHEILGVSPERFLRGITSASSLEIGLLFERAAEM